MMKKMAYVYDFVNNRLKIKNIAHSRDDMDIFLVNKGRWIDCIKGLQVSGTLSGEWCGHLAWREN